MYRVTAIEPGLLSTVALNLAIGQDRAHMSCLGIRQYLDAIRRTVLQFAMHADSKSATDGRILRQPYFQKDAFGCHMLIMLMTISESTNQLHCDERL